MIGYFHPTNTFIKNIYVRKWYLLGQNKNCTNKNTCRLEHFE